MPYAQLSKLTLKDMGEPAVIKTLPETTRELLLGSLYGKANDFVHRTSPDGQDKYEGLGGNFRMIPIDLNGEIREEKGKESAILFIPEAFHNAIADQLRKAKAADASAEVMFVYDVSVIRAKNPQGYSWSFMPSKEYTRSPLEDLVLEHRAMKAKLALVEHPSTSAQGQPKQIAGGKK